MSGREPLRRWHVENLFCRESICAVVNLSVFWWISEVVSRSVLLWIYLAANPCALANPFVLWWISLCWGESICFVVNLFIVVSLCCNTSLCALANLSVVRCLSLLRWISVLWQVFLRCLSVKLELIKIKCGNHSPSRCNMTRGSFFFFRSVIHPSLLR